MEFDDLISFNEKDMQMMANYQPIIIKTIVEHMWENEAIEFARIKEELEFYNKDREVDVTSELQH